MTHDSERKLVPSRILTRLLDHRRRLDYLWLAAFAAVPIVLAAAICAHRSSSDGFAGYWDRPNWTLLVFVLPIATFALRWFAKCIGPVSTRDLPSPPPPVVSLIETEAGREKAYAGLRKALLSPKALLAAVIITLMIHVVDLAPLGAAYISGISKECPVSEVSDESAGCAKESERSDAVNRLQVEFFGCCLPPVEKDWSVAFLSSDNRVGKGPNLALNLSAYAVQFALLFIGIQLIILVFRHNLFFLSCVYQRRRVAPGEEALYIHINLKDRENCFGFREANRAFNVQVWALLIAAILTLITRFANVGPCTGLFPDAGQWIAVVAWLAALVVTSLPIFVKLLPRLPSRGAERMPQSMVGYLREFLSDEAWAFGDDTSTEEVETVAGRFAENAFWPTGDNRAWRLYLFAFFVFFVALVPDPRAIGALADLPCWSKIVGWVIAGALALGATWALFRLIRAMLTYIDKRLVEPPERLPFHAPVPWTEIIEIDVFISYRREDSGPHTGRLKDSLSDHINKDRIFMDVDTIHGGDKFVEEMKKAIDSAQAMIVVIGPEWLTIERDGAPRIQSRDDPVHLEVARGLERDIRVIPVLVGGAEIPSKADLPKGLKKLADLSFREITDSRWEYDVGQLIGDLEEIRRTKLSGKS